MGTLLSLPSDRFVDYAVGGGVELALPIGRTYDVTGFPLLHVLEPFLHGSLATAHGQPQSAVAAARPASLASGSFWTSTAGVRTSLGSPYADSGVRLAARAGGLGRWRALRDVAPLVHGELELEQWWGAVSSEGAATGRSPVGVAGLVQARVGDPAHLHLSAALAARSGADCAPALVSSLQPWSSPGLGWLREPGTSVAGGAFVPLGLGLHLEGDSAWDLTSGSFVAADATLGYVHPCRCLRLAGSVARRLGRPGLDAFLSLDLLPFGLPLTSATAQARAAAAHHGARR
jgi:hypothetical protein